MYGLRHYDSIMMWIDRCNVNTYCFSSERCSWFRGDWSHNKMLTKIVGTGKITKFNLKNIDIRYDDARLNIYIYIFIL